MTPLERRRQARKEAGAISTAEFKRIAAQAASTAKQQAEAAAALGAAAITKASLGLGNVDNTSDANKPVSTAQQTALDLKAPKANPTFTGTVAGVTKSMVGLGDVDNTADAAKPVSTAQQTAIDAKASMVGAPASAGASGTAGQIAYDADFFYVCTATNTWKRAAIATW